MIAHAKIVSNLNAVFENLTFNFFTHLLGKNLDSNVRNSGVRWLASASLLAIPCGIGVVNQGHISCENFHVSSKTIRRGVLLHRHIAVTVNFRLVTNAYVHTLRYSFFGRFARLMHDCNDSAARRQDAESQRKVNHVGRVRYRWHRERSATVWVHVQDGVHQNVG